MLVCHLKRNNNKKRLLYPASSTGCCIFLLGPRITLLLLKLVCPLVELVAYENEVSDEMINFVAVFCLLR